MGQLNKLNPKQAQFLRLYTGQSKLAGNGTRCYMAAYEVTDVLSAQTCAHRLLKQPYVKDILAKAEAKALEDLTINAGYVLDQSVRLYERAMGDAPIEQVVITTKAGIESTEIREVHSYDPKTAKAVLQLIGQHKDVQAFAQTVEHTHTHRLEQRLAARSKVIEGKALSNGNGGDTLPAPAPQAEEVEKRVHLAPNSNPAISQDESATQIEGATANEYIDKSISPADITPPRKRRSRAIPKPGDPPKYSGVPNRQARESQDADRG